MTLEEAFVTVTHQALRDGARAIAIGDDIFRVTATAKQNLRQVNFRFDNRDFRGIEKNFKTKSRWAAMARPGKKVMQFVEGGMSRWWRMGSLFPTKRQSVSSDVAVASAGNVEYPARMTH